MSTLDILKAARELIADIDHWTQDYYATDNTGREVSVEDTDASCFCATGALIRTNLDQRRTARKLLCKAAQSLFTIATIESVNDGMALSDEITIDNAYEEAHRQTLACYDLAIQKVQAGEW